MFSERKKCPHENLLVKAVENIRTQQEVLKTEEQGTDSDRPSDLFTWSWTFFLSVLSSFTFCLFLFLPPPPPPPHPPPPSFVPCQRPQACFLTRCHDSRPRCYHRGHLHSSTEHARPSEVRIPVLKRLHPVELEYARCVCVCVCVCLCVCVCVCVCVCARIRMSSQCL